MAGGKTYTNKKLHCGSRAEKNWIKRNGESSVRRGAGEVGWLQFQSQPAQQFEQRSWISRATEQSCSRGAHGKAEVNHPFPDSPHVKGIQRCIVGYDTSNPPQVSKLLTHTFSNLSAVAWLEKMTNVDVRKWDDDMRERDMCIQTFLYLSRPNLIICVELKKSTFISQ